MRRSPVVGAAGLVLAAVLTSCSAANRQSHVDDGVPRPAHVMVVIFENEDAEDVLGSAEAPYLTALAASAASFDNAHGETHPSQPNYLALFSGASRGVTD